MAGVIASQWMRHCFHHFLFGMWHRLWRRKPVLLAIILVVTLFFVAVQYSTVSVNLHKNQNPPSFSSLPHIHLHKENDANDAEAMIPRRNLSALYAQGPANQLINERKPSDDRIHDGESKVIQDSQYSQYRQRTKVASVVEQGKKNNVPEYGIFDAKSPQDAKLSDTVNKNNAFESKQDALEPTKQHYIPPIRLVHFDLKGAPPKISYFKQIFKLLKEAGATGILLEYEDMFPFSGHLKPAAAYNAYTYDDIKEIISLAESHNLELIPLIQTFGHLEFFLKLAEFRRLREVDDYPQAICPSKNDSFTLIAQMVDQVIAMHPTSKWLHIGCDEVYHLGYCDKCRYKERDSLFLNHVVRVAKYVREKHNVIPIIWDDMLRQISPDKLKDAQLGKIGVEPMIWTYIKDVYRFIPYQQWMTLSDVFPHVWAASAFKGAFGETLTVPNVKMHLENNEAWVEVMAEQSKNFKSIRGIAITGWQRYDHLGTLCELLPAGMPSLIVNLLTTSQGGFDSKLIFKKFDKIMGCNSNHNVNNYYSQQDVDFDNDPYLFTRTASCFFPGSAVYRLMQYHTDAIKRVNDYLYDVTIHKAWLTDYNIRHNISSPYRVDEGLQEYSTVYYGLQSVLKTAKEALKEVYDDYTVSEWIEQNIYPYLIKMEKLMENSVNLKKAKTWPKRPLKPLEDLKRYSIGTDQANNNNNYGK